MAILDRRGFGRACEQLDLHFGSTTSEVADHRYRSRRRTAQVLGALPAQACDCRVGPRL
jgi:hypothetical protein